MAFRGLRRFLLLSFSIKLRAMFCGEKNKLMHTTLKAFVVYGVDAAVTLVVNVLLLVVFQNQFHLCHSIASTIFLPSKIHFDRFILNTQCRSKSGKMLVSNIGKHLANFIMEKFILKIIIATRQQMQSCYLLLYTMISLRLVFFSNFRSIFRTTFVSHLSELHQDRRRRRWRWKETLRDKNEHTILCKKEPKKRDTHTDKVFT